MPLSGAGTAKAKDCQDYVCALSITEVNPANSASRTAQLEQLESKIEHLVNALSATQTNGSSSTVSPPLSARPENPPQLLSLDRSHSNMCPEIPAEYLEPDTGPSQESAAAFAPPKSIEGQCQFTGFSENRDYNDLGVTISEAEILLDRYQRLMSYALPFVVLPGEITARQLYLQKPFLLHAIGTVTYFHDLPKQQIMVKQMMRDVSERVLMNNEKTLDIIQGILVLVAWYHPHVFWNQQVCEVGVQSETINTDFKNRSQTCSILPLH